MEQLTNYTNALQEIYDYFDFKEDWTVFPIDDGTDYYWEVKEDEGIVKFYDSVEAYRTEDGSHSYSNEILHHRHYPKAIYEGAEYTMIMVDTHTDGNRFLQIFDNFKKIK